MDLGPDKPTAVSDTANAATPPRQEGMTREAVMQMLVNKFLAWPLPPTVCSDLCATKQDYPHRSGTTLLSAGETRQMVEHLFTEIVDQSIAQRETIARLEGELAKWERPFDADMLNEMKAQASHGNSLAAQQAYINALEHGVKHLQTRLTASEAKHEWTRERPTVAGWYWFRSSSDHTPECVHVVDVEIVMVAGSNKIRDPKTMFGYGCEWQGPLTPGE